MKEFDENEYDIDRDAERLAKEILETQKVLLEKQQRQLVIAEYKNAVDKELLEFVKKYQNGQNKEDNWSKFELGAVTERQAQDIKDLLGFDVVGYKHILTSSTVRHIEKRHGEKGSADHSMSSIEDIARVKYVLENYDNMQTATNVKFNQFNKDMTSAKGIVCCKRINGTIYIVEVIPDSKNKTATVWSAYIEKAQLQKEVVQSEISSGKCTRPCLTPKNELELSTNNIISQRTQNVNAPEMDDFEMGED